LDDCTDKIEEISHGERMGVEGKVNHSSLRDWVALKYFINLFIYFLLFSLHHISDEFLF